METDNNIDDDKGLTDGDLLLLVDLPEVALVEIMEYLNLKERYHLSITCKLFFDLFTHPQLWQSAHIDLICAGKSNTKDYSRWKLKYVMRSTMVEIVRRFSYVFHHLSLTMNDNIQPFDNVSGTVLEELKQASQLQSLTLRLGPLTSDHENIRRVMSSRSDPQDFPMVVDLIHSAERLKRLNIISWPLFTELEDSSIMKAIQSNDNLKKLDSLSLFFINVKKESWSERIPKLPTIVETFDTIGFLSNLTHLALRSPMINDETILLLATPGRIRLELFQILLTFANPTTYHNGFNIPEIESSSWKKLVCYSPHLQVELFVMTRVPCEQLQIFLKSEVPLSSFSLLTYSQCNSSILDCITTQYASTLKSFTSLCDSYNCDVALKRLVCECRHLRCLVYHGEINYKTVMELVDLTRHEYGQWDRFEIKEKNIKTNYIESEEDEDEVVKFDAANQRYYLGSVHAWHVNEDFHNPKLVEMTQHVQKSLSKPAHSFLV